MLVLAIWLYEDFPSVELVVDYTDHPHLCDQVILRYSIFNTTVLKPAAKVFNTTELLYPPGSPQNTFLSCPWQMAEGPGLQHLEYPMACRTPKGSPYPAQKPAVTCHSPHPNCRSI